MPVDSQILHLPYRRRMRCPCWMASVKTLVAVTPLTEVLRRKRTNSNCTLLAYYVQLCIYIIYFHFIVVLALGIAIY